MDISEIQKVNAEVPLRRHPWEIARARVIIHLLKKNGLHQVNAVTDIGSGDCFVLNELSNAGVGKIFTAIDSEFNEAIIAGLEKKYPQVSQFYTSLEAYNISAAEKAGLFLLTDVIEHIEDDGGFLDLLSASPRKATEAWCLISVPAFQSLFSEHDELLGHYRRYKLQQLKKLCIAHKMEVADSGYFFFSLLIPRFFSKLFRSRKKQFVYNWTGGRFITRLITGTLWLDFRTGRLLKKLGIQLPGLSCYCLCRLSQS